MILSGTPSQSLAAALADATGEELGVVDYEWFPDGETMVRVPDLDGERAVVVTSTVSSDAHVQALLLQDAAREAGADEVVTVVPYMGYARQDTAFRSGEPVSARAVARALSTGTDRVVTVNPHEEAVCDFFTVPATSVDAAPLLGDALPSLDDPVFLAPDEGAAGLAETVRAAAGGGEVDYFTKTRHSGTEVEIEPNDVSVTDRDVVVVDDIVATGSTMSEAIAVLDSPARVVVACVHPLFAASARSKLAAAGVDAVYATDTIERPVSTVSAADAVADAL